MTETVLITGGAGFIGRHVAAALLARGDRVRVLDSLIEQVHPTRARPAELDADVELIVGDVRDDAAVLKALKGVDKVLHLAAEVGVGQSMYAVERYTSVGGYERVVTPAGTFDAIRLRVLMRLDDETFWRTPTECNYLVWYAPALGISVREEREGEYREKSDAREPWSTIRVQHALMTLVSFTRAP